MRHKLLMLIMAIFITSASYADLYIWGGGGTEALPYYWDDTDDGGDGVNEDADHWGVIRVPNVDGTDAVIINSGGVRIDAGLTVEGESFLEVNGGYLWCNGLDAGSVTAGARVTISGGFADCQWISGFAGSVFEIRGGKVNVRGGNEPIPDRVDGYIDFTGHSGTITAPAKSQAYFETKILGGNIRIDGIQLTAVDENINGKSFILSGTTLTLKDVSVAHDPDPFDGETDVELDRELAWKTAMDPNNPALINSDVLRHFVFIGSDEDPNLRLITIIDAEDPPAETVSFAVEGLQRDRTYYWRIDQGIGDWPAGDPNNLIGQVWTFETKKSTPIIDPVPAEARGFVGGEVEMTVSAINPYTSDTEGLEYQWYQVPSTPIIGADTPTLIVEGLTEEDEGTGYFCRVTIPGVSFADSGTITILINKLILHWPLDGDPNDVSGSGMDGVAQGDPTYGQGILDRAVIVDGAEDAISYVLPAEETFPQFTVSLWAKPLAINQATNSSPFNNDSSGNDFQIELTSSNRYRYNGSATAEFGDVVLDEWAHLAVSCDGAETRLYFNGQYVATVNEVRNVFGQYTIGVNRAGATFFNGAIDDVKVYNYAMDPFQVADIYIKVKPDEKICAQALPGDVNGDCTINLEDILGFARDWLKCNIVPDCIN